MPRTLPRVLLAAIIGISTSSALYLFRHNSLKGEPGEAMSPVVIVKKPILAGMRVAADALEIQSRPRRYLPPGTLQEVSKAIGQEARWPLLPGEPLLESRLARPGQAVEESLPIPAGRRGMTVAVNEVSGVGGFLGPGSVVDVIATWEVGGTARSKLILQRLPVLAVAQENRPSEDRKAKVATSATLAVTPIQAEALVLASERGTIRLAMRSRGETAEATTPGRTIQSLTGPAPLPAPHHPPRRHASAPQPRPKAPAPQTAIVVLRGPQGPSEAP